MFSVKEDLFGIDSKIKKAISLAINMASTKSPILIVGESGVGKKSLATLIHERSNRADNKILFVNCSDGPSEVENAILGYRDEETGKFIRGALEEGNRGSVVFTNIDALEESFQKRLFKIIQELGDYDLDVRLMATTTKNLSKLVGSGRFHRALYTYFSKTPVSLIPLRDRLEDIEFLTACFLDEVSAERGINRPRLTPEAKEKLLAHYWTHNISELKMVIERTLDAEIGETLDIDQLAIGEKKSIQFELEESEDGIALMSLKEAEKLLIKKALIHTSENRTQAAKILGVSIRTLRNKINEYRNEGANYFINLR